MQQKSWRRWRHGPCTAIFQNSGGGGGVAYKDRARPPPPPRGGGLVSDGLSCQCWRTRPNPSRNGVEQPRPFENNAHATHLRGHESTCTPERDLGHAWAHDPDAFPPAIFGMAIPPTSEFDGRGPQLDAFTPKSLRRQKSHRRCLGVVLPMPLEKASRLGLSVSLWQRDGHGQ